MNNITTHIDAIDKKNEIRENDFIFVCDNKINIGVAVNLKKLFQKNISRTNLYVIKCDANILKMLLYIIERSMLSLETILKIVKHYITSNSYLFNFVGACIEIFDDSQTEIKHYVDNILEKILQTTTFTDCSIISIINLWNLQKSKKYLIDKKIGTADVIKKSDFGYLELVSTDPNIFFDKFILWIENNELTDRILEDNKWIKTIILNSVYYKDLTQDEIDKIIKNVLINEKLRFIHHNFVFRLLEILFGNKRELEESNRPKKKSKRLI